MLSSVVQHYFIRIYVDGSLFASSNYPYMAIFGCSPKGFLRLLAGGREGKFGFENGGKGLILINLREKSLLLLLRKWDLGLEKITV